MNILLIVAVLALIAGILLLAYWFWLNKRSFSANKNLGILKSKNVYKDLEAKPGEVLPGTGKLVLFAKSLSLCGKPDSLIDQGGMIIPVEIKSGSTPIEPYQNHIMQLMAYCILVEENCGVRPTGGYLKYPDKEFKIAYTDEARDSIKELVGEMLLLKHSGKELHCNHPEHNR